MLVFYKLLELLFGPFVYWHTFDTADGKENFGDVLTPFLWQQIRHQNPKNYKKFKPIRYKKGVKNYFVIGSILMVANSKSVILGSGIIKRNDRVPAADYRFVRGKFTRNRVLEMGFECPEKYGDPALVLPQIYQPSNQIKTQKIGIIPHYVNYSEVVALYGQDSRFEIVNLMTHSITEVIDQICSCSHIISSSLHGIIVANAYGIPAAWVEFHKNLAGDNIKFLDYFSSVTTTDRYPTQPQKLEIGSLDSLEYFEIHDKTHLEHMQHMIVKEIKNA